MQLAARDLQTGDIVRTMEGPYGTATVQQVTEDKVYFYRPYAVTSGFTYGNGRTICYTGVEQWSVDRGDHEYLVYRREVMR